MGRSLIAISGKTKGLLCLGLSCVIATRRGPSVDRLMGRTLIAATRRGPRSGRNPYCRA